MQTLIDRIVEHDPAWRAEPLPLGLKREILDDPKEAKHFDGFASACGYKSDAEWNLLDLIRDDPNFTLLTETRVTGLLHADGAPTEITGVRCHDGSTHSARVVILAAGAMTSPRLLQDHLAATRLKDRWPNAGVIGGNFKFHVNSAILGVGLFHRHDVLRKTAILYNDAFPHSTIQCLGWMDGEMVATQLPAAVPKFASDAIGGRAIGFFATTEDGSSLENRIVSHGEAVPAARGLRPPSYRSLARPSITPSSDTLSAGCCAPGWWARNNTTASPAPPTPSARWSPATTRRPAPSTPPARSTA